MSKFLLTNSEEVYSRAKERLRLSPFKLGLDFNDGGIRALTTVKLMTENRNFHREGGDFALTNGTPLYAVRPGEGMHAEMLAAFDGAAGSLRDSCYGIFAAGLYKGKRLTVFGDRSSIYDIFYYSGGGVWAVSSSLSLLAQALKGKLTVSRLNLMESLVKNCVLGGETVFNEIRRLGGHEVLRADAGGLSAEGGEAAAGFRSCGGAAAEEAALALKKIAGLFSERYGRPAVSLTGGLDSRAVLASYLSAGVRPDIVYGLGGSAIIKSSEKEAEIDREYSRRFGLELSVLPLNDTLPADRLWDELIAGLEDDALFTRGNKDIIDYFARSPYAFLEIGKFGEFYRDAGWWNIVEDGGRATVSDVADKWYFKSMDENIIETYPGLREHMLSKLGKCARKYGADPGRIGRRDLQVFALEYYTLSAHVINFVNRFKFCSCIIAESEVWSKFYDADRKDSSPVLRLLNALYPAVLDVPIYSRWRRMRYDRKSMKLKLSMTNGKGLLLTLASPGMMKALKSAAGYQKMPPHISRLCEDYAPVLRKWLPEDAVGALRSASDNRASFIIKLLMWDKLLAHWGMPVE